jgi:hypothetical protein
MLQLSELGFLGFIGLTGIDSNYLMLWILSDFSSHKFHTSRKSQYKLNRLSLCPRGIFINDTTETKADELKSNLQQIYSNNRVISKNILIRTVNCLNPRSIGASYDPEGLGQVLGRLKD